MGVQNFESSVFITGMDRKVSFRKIIRPLTEFYECSFFDGRYDKMIVIVKSRDQVYKIPAESDALRYGNSLYFFVEAITKFGRHSN